MFRVFNILYTYFLQTGPLFQHDIASEKTRWEIKDFSQSTTNKMRRFSIYLFL